MTPVTRQFSSKFFKFGNYIANLLLLPDSCNPPSPDPPEDMEPQLPEDLSESEEFLKSETDTDLTMPSNGVGSDRTWREHRCRGPKRGYSSDSSEEDGDAGNGSGEERDTKRLRCLSCVLQTPH